MYQAIGDAAQQAGATVFAHARDIDSGVEIGWEADAPVVTGSVLKVPVLTDYVRRVEAGDVDPRQRIQVAAGSVTEGSTGLSVFSDDVTISLRDLATSMITVSDNGATDLLIGMLGVDHINATMAALGLPGTVLTGDCRSLFASMEREFDASGPALARALASATAERIAAMDVCTPARTCRSTPAESTRLLQLLWTDAAAGRGACAEARRILGLQVWPHRLAAGFPRDDVTISGKTGTIGTVRNEVGVVEYPDGQRIAIGVFLRCQDPAFRQPRADALIGTIAAALAAFLRGEDAGSGRAAQ